MPDIDQMIKVLSGEATVEEYEQLDEAMTKDPKLREQYESLRLDWESATDAMLFRGLDEDAAWDRQEAIVSGATSPKKDNVRSTMLKIAASLLIIFGAFFYWYLFSSSGEKLIEITGAGDTREIQLQDGSKVILNENTTVEYLITEDKRELKLKGEAYFQVAKNEEIPFVVETDHAYITVLGTSFDVNCYNKGTFVKVDEGSVELAMINGNDKVILSDGQLGEVVGRVLSHNSDQPNFTSWYTKSLVFQEASLEDVLKDLEKTYYIDFQFEQERVDGCRLTADFSDEKLENVLATITLIFNVEFTQLSDQSFEVKMLGCK